MRVTSAKLPIPASLNWPGPIADAPNGARDSGTSSKPPIATLGGACPVTVTVCGVSCAAAGQAAAAASARTNECLAIVELRFDVAGRQTERAGREATHPEHASLREDYLSQVQRDFLSRTLADPAPLAKCRALGRAAERIMRVKTAVRPFRRGSLREAK